MTSRKSAAVWENASNRRGTSRLETRKIYPLLQGRTIMRAKRTRADAPRRTCPLNFRPLLAFRSLSVGSAVASTMTGRTTA